MSYSIGTRITLKSGEVGKVLDVSPDKDFYWCEVFGRIKTPIVVLAEEIDYAEGSQEDGA